MGEHVGFQPEACHSVLFENDLSRYSVENKWFLRISTQLSASDKTITVSDWRRSGRFFEFKTLQWAFDLRRVGRYI
jgi:hypothetical protein